MQERLEAGGLVTDIGDGVTRVGLAVACVRTVEDRVSLLAALGECRFPDLELVLTDIELGLSVVCVKVTLGGIGRNVTL